MSVCVLRVRVQSRCTSHGAVADCSIHRPRVSRAFEFGASAQVEKVVPARTKTCERCKERYLLLKKKKNMWATVVEETVVTVGSLTHNLGRTSCAALLMEFFFSFFSKVF